ncbi:glycosyltransferase family 2 protein [Streptomyces sp. NPDC048324]|uniref:glycosyltransferase family 2 protein n=1 Tax=Streptomyces sp. NPDC048324 TaxID=3157205 RepID=UPI00342E144A
MVGDLDIVIVNWNTGPWLRKCLQSVTKCRHPGFTIASVVVVDNASTDGSADRLDALPLPLSVLRNATNHGFAAACNQGARRGCAPFVLFLNPDTELYEDTLDRALGFLRRPDAASVGICGGQMIDADGTARPSCSRFPRPSTFLAKASGVALVLPRLAPHQWMSVAEVDGSRPVDQVIGAFFLVRRGLFEELGGFDERFFLYYEEVDLSYRARDAGFLSYHLADARVRHIGGVSSRQVPALRLFHSLRSRTEYARLHWPRGQTLALTGIILALELPGRMARAAARGRWDDLRSVLAACRRYVAYLGGAGRRARADGQALTGRRV